MFGVGHDVGQHGPDPYLVGRLRHRLDVAVHVVHGRHAEPDRFRVAEQRAPIDGFGIDGPNQRVPERVEVHGQREVIGPASPESGVVMEIDQTGEHGTASRVEDGGAGRRASPYVRGRAHGADPVAVDRDGAIEEHIMVFVQRDDDGVVYQQHLGSAIRRGRPSGPRHARTRRSPPAGPSLGRSS
jgi:hypothetical protein